VVGLANITSTLWVNGRNVSAEYQSINITANIQNLINGTDINLAHLGIGTTSPSAILEVNLTGTNVNQTALWVHNITSANTYLIVNGTSGSVGIGTASPTEKLHTYINGATNILKIETATSGDAILWLQNTGAGNFYLVSNRTTTTTQFINPFANDFAWWANGAEVMRLTNAGNVGIGTTSPQLGLHVEKDNGNGWAMLVRNGSTSEGLLIGNRPNATLQGISANYPVDLGTYTNLLLNPLGGNVGIGTTSPTYKLEIGGTTGAIFNASGVLTIAQRSVNITGNLWINGVNNTAPDYVFEDWINETIGITNETLDIGKGIEEGNLTNNETTNESIPSTESSTPTYEFKNLSETKNYILNYSHLPNMPSAEEVANIGLNVMEDRNKLLEKIEEIFLHLFGLDKRITNLEEENNILKRELCNSKVYDYSWCN
jgi:hypothetical protein